MPLFPPSGSSRSSFGSSTRLAPVGVIDPPAKSIVLLTAGDITVKTQNSAQDIAFKSLPSGYIIPFIVSEVVALANGATAVTIDG